MRAAGIESFGGDVRMLELPAPQSLAPDEVMIAVRAAGVGNWDEIVRVGGWDVGRRPPLALGVEAAGVDVAVGEEVTSLAPGDGVLAHPLPLRHQGTWAERLVAPAALVDRQAGCGSVGDCGRVPGARAHRRPGAQRGRAGPERRMRARARRRWCNPRARHATRDHARGDRCCDGRPTEC
jgi:NADPH:quinone reductase-like Zn-dependent oxidoreductase